VYKKILLNVVHSFTREVVMTFYEPRSNRPFVIQDLHSFLRYVEALIRLAEGGHLATMEFEGYLDEESFQTPTAPPSEELAERDYEGYIEACFVFATAHHLRSCSTCRQAWERHLFEVNKRTEEYAQNPTCHAAVEACLKFIGAHWEKKPENN
jgi:hypothetical protein